MSADSPQPFPYAPPTASLEDVAQDSYEPKLFALDGRIGRVRFLAYSSLAMLLAFCLSLVCVMITNTQSSGFDKWTVFDLINVVPYIATATVPLIYARRRLHDIGVSGWRSLLLFVPILGIGVFFYIACKHGAAGSNIYGPPPHKNRIVTVVYAILLPPPALWCLIMTILNGIGELRR
ncbi:MAG: DUF805 domain-containing protein [Burkholderiaceae bacterium]|nr:DUF805 domain-containing protein [Burkholderiaceae bacterium]